MDRFLKVSLTRSLGRKHICNNWLVMEASQWRQRCKSMCRICDRYVTHINIKHVSVSFYNGLHNRFEDSRGLDVQSVAFFVSAKSKHRCKLDYIKAPQRCPTWSCVQDRVHSLHESGLRTWFCVPAAFPQCSAVKNSLRTTHRKKAVSTLLLLEKFTNACKVAHLGHCIRLLLDFNTPCVVYSGRARSLKCLSVPGMLMRSIWWAWYVVERFSRLSTNILLLKSAMNGLQEFLLLMLRQYWHPVNGARI